MRSTVVTDAISKPKDKTRPSFLSIPGEIRNRIYRLVLLDPRPVLLRAIDQKGRNKALRIGSGTPVLLYLCRQIYWESSQIYYQENMFAFQDETLHINAIYAFNDKIWDFVKNLDRVTVYRTYKIGDMKLPFVIQFEIRINNRKQLVIVRPENEGNPFPGYKSKLHGPYYEPCRCEVSSLLVKSQRYKMVNGYDIIGFLTDYVELTRQTAETIEIEICEKCNSVRLGLATKAYFAHVVRSVAIDRLC